LSEWTFYHSHITELQNRRRGYNKMKRETPNYIISIQSYAA